MITVLVVPSSVGVMATLFQFVVPMPVVFSWRVKPVEGDGHDIATLFVVVIRIANDGAYTNSNSHALRPYVPTRSSDGTGVESKASEVH